MSYIIINEVTMKACRCATLQEVMDFMEHGEVPVKARDVKSANFRHLIQHPEPDRLMQRLHKLIDGSRGADVGCVLLRCVQENYLIRNPTRAEFCSEFRLVGSWGAIHNYMDENSENALLRANKVVIF